MLGGKVHRDDEDGYKRFKQVCLNEPKVTGFEFVHPPLGIDTKQFVSSHFGHNSMARNMHFAKGTTTLAFIYEPLTDKDTGGIVVAVDSRASSGEYISSKSVMKILDVGDRMVATMAGGAADCQFWTRVVAMYCNLYELREKSEITISAASKYFANQLYGYRNKGLSIGSMVAGYDKKGPAIFQVDSEGSRLPLRVCSIGSGSLNAYGVLDTHYKPKMTDEEALKLGRRAIMLATFRDAGSGGFCNVAHITPKGKTRYPPMDVQKLFEEFADEMKRDYSYQPSNAE
uniref:Proteasome endopeptidase complex n=1 Tax=Panagrolaimus sp. JU765 TaxID=591449 RepID=A0AC34QW12_9BILA